MNLLEWRTSKGFNQQQTAEHFGLTQATVSRIESGGLFPSAKMLSRLFLRSDGEITADDVHAAWQKATAA